MSLFIIFKKFSLEKFIHYSYSFLFGLIAAMAVFLISQQLQIKPKHIATVNITTIIKQYTQAEDKKKLSDTQLKNETNRFGKQLEATLKQLSRDRQLVLLPSEAVIAGCEDYTQLVITLMQENNHV
jgi:uncharacterized membrane protein